MVENTDFTPEQKIMLAFAFMGDIESGKQVISKIASEQKAKDTLNSAFKNSYITDYMGNWSCENVWIYSNRGEARNTNVVFVSEDGTELVIAVAGTNFINNYDWFTEDFLVGSQVNWAPDIVNAGARPKDQFMGQISEGTAIALQNSWNLKCSILDEKTLVEWLRDYLASPHGENISKVTVSGHSLGGAISPVLAQALADHESEWNIQDRIIEIRSFLYAGPGIADQGFVNYVQNGKVQLNSVYNTKDVVPHSWLLRMLNNVHDLFVPFLPDDSTEDGKIVARAIQWAKEESAKPAKTKNDPALAYLRWNTPEKTVEYTFQGDVPPSPGEGIHADASKLTKVISTMLKGILKKEKEALASLCAICGVSTNQSKKDQVNDLQPYLNYFSIFLILLGGEHIGQYYKWVFRNGEFEAALKSYLAGKKSIVDASGLEVLLNLFILIKP